MSIGNLILGVESVTVPYLILYDILLQNASDIITKCDNYLLQNKQKFITKRVRFFITKCEGFIIKCNNYYKLR